MRNRALSLWLVVIATAATVASISPAAAAPMFMGLGNLPGGSFSEGTGISADGSTVIGVAGIEGGGWEAVRWVSGSVESIGDLPGQNVAGQALAVSGDGSVVAGVGTAQGGNEAFRWESGVMTGLGELPGGIADSLAWDVSRDGSVVVGQSDVASGIVAVRWDEDGIAALGIGADSQAFGVNADGSVIVGGAGASAFLWENGSASILPHLAGESGSRAIRVSPDGFLVVGRSGGSAVLWNNGVPVDLGTLAGGTSQAQGLSADGSVVIGTTHNPSTPATAFIWTEATGIRNLGEFLVADLGLDLAGWTLTNASGISADGLKIVGTGTNPSGSTEAWIAVIPEPNTGLLVMTGLLGIAYRRRRNGRAAKPGC